MPTASICLQGQCRLRVEWGLSLCKRACHEGLHASSHLPPRREFAKRLWGDLYFWPEERVFRRQASKAGSGERTFVQFVLDPLYKLYSQVISEWGAEGRGRGGRAGAGVGARTRTMHRPGC